tara:strand:- start:156 stop:1109 length:954 start_codon:yes stop_codon:yes gene_type:complete
MLSRTAENLFWIARYIERAESMSRLIEMGSRMAMLPTFAGREEWRSILIAARTDIEASPDHRVTEAEIIHELILSLDNPSSIASCLKSARNNGRNVRSAITQEMWEALNDGWARLANLDELTAQRELPSLIDWIKQRSSIFRGAAETGMIRDDGYNFLRLGGALERADMTLRLLDIKYYVLLPDIDRIGGGRDHHQWTSILHAMSATRAYQWVYRGDFSPWRIADFLILNSSFPRSVHFCYQQIGHFLNRLNHGYAPQSNSHAVAQEMISKMAESDMSEIFRDGLHEFILDAIAHTHRLNSAISESYYFEPGYAVKY